MKKILSLLVLLVAFTSCEEDVKFNNPAVQGLKDDELWRATEFSAVKTGTLVTVTATNGFETIVLKMDSPMPLSTHTLGENATNMATYALSVDGINEFYQTGTNVGNGVIKIRDSKDTDIAKGYISGNFFFNAVNEEGDVVNFKDGVFYKIPITTGTP
jgi:hypothetical protein